ncbi:MAG TPA: DUF3179 domain-containing (seleno)protein [Bryobacteraceae bacterium]|nr:DUF3179 domain-containing (seleno)protein [Bryobacteraceae bacterium]
MSTICAVLAAALIWSIWTRGGRCLARTAAILLAMAAVGGSYLAWFNIYERIMFHPLATPQFAAADQVAMDSNDMEIAVQVKDERRAYPIREMAYHRLVNDVLAGEPIAATY